MRRVAFLALMVVLVLAVGPIYGGGSPKQVVLTANCLATQSYGSPELAGFIKESLLRRHDLQRQAGRLAIKWDLDEDGSPEYFVLYSGGSGGGNYILVADSPPRIIGEMSGLVIWFDRTSGEWPALHCYNSGGATHGLVCEFRFSSGKYVQTMSSELEDSPDGSFKKHEIQDLWKSLGPVSCNENPKY